MVKKMTNTAIVNRVDRGNIYLVHIKDYGKKEKTERSFWNIKDYEFIGENPKDLDLKEGDPVEYFIPEGRTILASFIMLIFPLGTFILTFALLGKLGLNSEKLKALLSLIAMTGSFFLNKLLKKAGLKETLPVIVKKVEKEYLKKLKKSCSDCGSCSACD